MMLTLYQTLTFLGAPLIQIYLKRRLATGKEDSARFSERTGESFIPRPIGPLIWVHAASVGESLSMLPLIGSLLEFDARLHILLTTGTVSSAVLMAERLPQRAFHQYVPVDRLDYVRRFIDHWKPDLALWTESEFWPNLIYETQKRGVPMILVNGRISLKSFIGWQRAKGMISMLLKNFDLCLGQTREDVERLQQLGAKKYKYVGNLKFSVPPLPVDTEELIRLQQIVGKRPLWLAASTHAGEEDMVAEAHQKIKEKHQSILTLLAPRHPERGQDIALMLKNDKGLNVAQRSKHDQLTNKTDVYLADTLGELGLFFRLAEIVFIGKSLVPLGGQNPLEALKLGCAVILGPHMNNFKNIAIEMCDQECAILVKNSADLAETISYLIPNVRARSSMIENGAKYMGSQSEVVENVKKEILSVMMSAKQTSEEHAAT